MKIHTDALVQIDAGTLSLLCSVSRVWIGHNQNHHMRRKIMAAVNKAGPIALNAIFPDATTKAKYPSKSGANVKEV